MYFVYYVPYCPFGHLEHYLDGRTLLPPVIPTFQQLFTTEANPVPIKIQHTNLPTEEEPMIKQEYKQPKTTNQQKGSRFKYPKKNVESNVVNQCISFIRTKSKSKGVLMRLLKCEQKVKAFYEIMKQANKKNKGYVGRQLLQELLEADEDHPVYQLFTKLKKSKIGLKFSEIKKSMRVLCNYFLRNKIVPAILTSSKLDKATVKPHLQRAKEIHAFINNSPSPYAE